jgi:hypothetical protein
VYGKSIEGRLVNRTAHKKYDRTEKGRIAQKHCRENYRATISGHLCNVFHHIKERCSNPKHSKFCYYGGRGIQCKFESSEEFVNYVILDLKIDPRGLDCDRIDNDGHYEKGNIQFISHKDNLAKRKK